MMTPPALHRSAVLPRSSLLGSEESALATRGSRRPRLVVGTGARWLALGHEDRVDLARRGLLRRLLSHLVAHRLERPDAPCSAGELIAAGWPGERIPIACAMNRLYVALCYLRKCGLGPVLRSDPEGWYLDGSVDVVREGEI